MIAFITIKSGLVPLIEGLCAQINYVDLRLSVVLRSESHLLLSFLEEKTCNRKKQLVQDLITPPSVYMHMCTLFMYTNTYTLQHTATHYNVCILALV